VKPSHSVKIGDEVTARAPRGLVVLVVSQLSERRLAPALARALYEDRSPPPPPRDEFAPLAMREAGAGRPTKRERRELDRFRGDSDD
jgi:ribosome-associated heat shock protein Hsp15